MYVNSTREDAESQKSSDSGVRTPSNPSKSSDRSLIDTQTMIRQQPTSGTPASTVPGDEELIQHLGQGQKAHIANLEGEPNEKSLNIPLADIQKRQRDIDDADWEQRRMAEERYKETQDPHAFDEILAPFLETDHTYETPKPLWTWIPEAQRWSCNCQGRKLWCPTLESLS